LKRVFKVLKALIGHAAPGQFALTSRLPLL
jgi:hypothetical protein